MLSSARTVAAILFQSHNEQSEARGKDALQADTAAAAAAAETHVGSVAAAAANTHTSAV